MEGPLPPEHGWHEFAVAGSKKATWLAAADVDAFTAMPPDAERRTGYMIGDRMLPDGVAVTLDPDRVLEQSVRVHVVEPGLPRFARGAAARWEDDRWIWVGQEFPLGPEADVTEAWQDRMDSVDHVPGVPPALDLAFRWQRHLRAEAARRREQLAVERAAEEARRRFQEAVGTGEGRRELARRGNFELAAGAALEISGAELLDHRESMNEGERVVQFRFEGRRFECVVDRLTLRIVDAGICLVDYESDIRGDARFTLESLPAVIKEAIDIGALHVYRHLDD